MPGERKTPEEIIAAAEAWANARLDAWVKALTVGGMWGLEHLVWIACFGIFCLVLGFAAGRQV